MMADEVIWTIPEPLSTYDVAVDSETVITLRQHGNPSGPRLVLCHGNGLAIDLYYPFWSLLVADFELIVYDLRNHGWNAVSSMGNHTLPMLVEDHDKVLAAIDAHYGNKPKVGVFHSVSALVTLLSPNKGNEFLARVLFDPPLCKPGRGYAEFEEAATRLATMARRRTPRFKTREELASVLPYLPPFNHAVAGIGDLYTRAILRESEDEDGYELRCPREYEAQIMEYASTFAVLVDFEAVLCPTKVIGADPTLPYSYLPSLDLSDVITVGYDFLPDATHFLQLEQPQECVELLHEYLDPIVG